MKTKFTFIKALLIVAISSISIVASAQAPTPPPGVTPSPGPTISTNVPNSGTPVAKFICVGAPVSLISTPVAAGVTNFVWWKQQTSTPPWVVVGNTPASTNTYTEATTAPGYYIYEVQTENALGCESPISDPINIFALPQIVPTISPDLTVCQSIASIPAPFSLSVTAPSFGGTYTYTYQWFRDPGTGTGPVDIPSTTNPSAITPTLTGLTENTVGTVTYGCKISYSTALGQPTGVTCVVQPTTKVTVTPLPAKPIIQWN